MSRIDKIITDSMEFYLAINNCNHHSDVSCDRAFKVNSIFRCKYLESFD